MIWMQPTSDAGAGMDRTLEHLMSSGEIVSGQTPSPTAWTPELRLAGAVLASALVEIRDHGRDKAYRRRVQQDLEWIASNDSDWPFSFVRLCQLFALEPDWVRRMTQRWLDGSAAPSEALRYRQAA